MTADRDALTTWECNECGSQEFTANVSEGDVGRMSCSGCGGSEWHRAAARALHPEPAALFQRGEFTLASGAVTNWKVECDALTDEDWRTLAMLGAALFSPRFSRAVGVPTGGEQLARAMQQYATEGPVLVCDDVLTTGGSLRRVMAEHPGSIGLVAFARGPVPDGVHAIWRLPEPATAREAVVEGKSRCVECKTGITFQRGRWTHDIPAMGDWSITAHHAASPEREG